MRRLRLVDLFAGCGGLTRGFVDVDKYASTATRFEVIAAVESDRAAAASYAANFGDEHLFHGRIEDWRDEDIPNSADVVVGGPPCQGFSNLGKRDPDDGRNALWREYARTVRKIQPKYFVIENVAAFFTSPQWDLLQSAVHDDGPLRNYVLQPYILNAAEFGVPQLRRRAVVLGHHRDLPPLPDPRKGHELLPGQYETVEKTLTRLDPVVPPGHIDLPDRTVEFKGTVVPGAFTTAELHITRRLEEISRLRIAHVKIPGGNRMDLPEELKTPGWRKHTTGSMDVMGRLHGDRPSVTIRTEFVKPEKGRYLHPDQPRPITHAEAALLQTFPMEHKWCGAKVSIARQIGNAVPVKLAAALAAVIAEARD